MIVHVPAQAGTPVRLLAVRDEDPQRPWQPLGSWWDDTFPGVVGVRDVRAGGAWLAADQDAGRVAVILNRADLLEREPAGSRGHIVLDAVAGVPVPAHPDTHGFNLVEATADQVSVTMWDGAAVRTVTLPPGIHMVAHDDVDDASSARIVAWRDAFDEPDATGDAPWWTAWLDVLERTAVLGSLDDRAIVRDNRPHGYPTLSLLVCAASIDTDGAHLAYGEFDQPGRWNRPEMHPL